MYCSSPTPKLKVTHHNLPISVLLLLHLQLCVAADNRTTLHIAVLIPFAHIDHSCTKHAIDMAVEDVNNKKSFIKNFVKNVEFRLQVHYMETGEGDGNAVDAMFRLFLNGSTKISTIGTPYNNQNELCAEVSTSQANIQVSYSEPNEPLQNYFYWFYQTTPSIVAKFIATRDIIKHFDWTQISILFDHSDEKYRKSADILRIILQETNSLNNTTTVKVLSAQGIWSTPSHYSVSAELNELQMQGARIIFAMVSVNGARKIFCEAHKSEMVKPKVTWFLFEKLPKDWATDKYNHGSSDITKREIDCTPEELMNAARGYISIVKQGIRIDGETTIGNQTKESYEKRLREAAQHDKCDESVAYAYDSIWVLAKTYQMYVKSTDLIYRYEQFQVAARLSMLLRTVQFEGVTGTISYEQHKALGKAYLRLGRISFWSHPDDETDIFVGTHDTKLKILSLQPNINQKLFDFGNIPKDKASYVLKFANFSKPLLITVWAIAILGIILAVSFLAITLYYVSTEHIKMDSPVINGVIVLGCVTCYLSVLAYGMDTRFVSASFIPSTCWTFLILLSIGFTLTFGSLFAKAWQLYRFYLASNLTAKNQPVTSQEKVPEYFLYLFLCGLVSIDIIFITTWYFVSPFHYEIKRIAAKENLFADTIYIEEIVGCSCKHESEFIIGMYCYKGLLLIFGIFLVWQTRNAKIKIENDSKQIGMAIYNVVAVSLIGVICVSVLANTTRYEALYAIIAVCICICNTTILMLFFLPKLKLITVSNDDDQNENKLTPTSKNSVSTATINSEL